MLFEVTSRKPLEQIDHALRDAAARHHFGVLTVHNLKEAMHNKGVEYTGECLVYEICNPLQAKRALEANPAISSALPCRISVYLEGDSCRLSTILPTALMEIFGTPALAPVAQEVERDVVAMMQESA